ncbi:hypothetical protein MSSIH_0963 [Methanosarcina siciliae HI350]|uniref:Uncharacterized protein n=1 Tax=Methanosarcina siciliae HI350 TaxID=1434119 RepID=A0A0E3PD64_9EURY|nr:hypothetical protein MSSIH_0963 [Methanosarcina siciliae HI350]
MFHYLPGAPAANNLIENYYPKCLKTDNEKQFKAEKGIENQIKLTQMKKIKFT